MDTVKGILILAVVLLSALCFVFFMQTSSQKAQLREANKLSADTLTLLKTAGVPCRGMIGDYASISTCIQPALEVQNFKEDEFIQADDKKGTAGSLVIKNVNTKLYDPNKLIFFVNRNKVQEGCENIQTGTISKGVTCRFSLAARCQPGDILEVLNVHANATNKVFMKTC